MSAAGDIEQAFARFKQLRDARTWRCDYRYTELEAFRMAVASLHQGEAEQSSQFGSPGAAGQRQNRARSPKKIPHQ